jgi:hypothetical protein
MANESTNRNVDTIRNETPAKLHQMPMNIKTIETNNVRIAVVESDGLVITDYRNDRIYRSFTRRERRRQQQNR